MVFTSTSGGPTSAAIRSMRLFAVAGSVVSAASRTDAVREFAQRLLVPVDRHYGQTAIGEGDGGGAARANRRRPSRSLPWRSSGSRSS